MFFLVVIQYLFSFFVCVCVCVCFVVVVVARNVTSLLSVAEEAVSVSHWSLRCEAQTLEK